MARRMGLWKCKNCGTTDITGTDDHCPNCAAPKPADVDYYLPEDAPAITDAKTLAQTGQPDWTCAYCGVANEFYRQDKCKQCGAEKGTSPSGKKTHFTLAQTPRTSSDADALAVERERQKYAPLTLSAHITPVDEPRPFTFPRIDGTVLGIGAGAFLLVGFVILMIWALLPHSMRLTVTGFSWERTINIEHYVTVRQEGWDLPGDARKISEEKRIKGYDHVIDHYVTKTKKVPRQEPDGYETVNYTDREPDGTYVCGHTSNGDGTFDDVECTKYKDVPKTKQVQKFKTVYDDVPYQDPVYRDDPIYAQWYVYDVDRWVHSRDIPTSGNDNEPFWGSFNLDPNERESGRSEAYYVVFTDDKGKTYPAFNLDFTRWQALGIGEKVDGKVNNLGLVVSFESK